MRRAGALFLCAAMAGCQTAPANRLAWTRVDGQVVNGNPALMQQYQVDAAVCLGETQKSAVGMPVIYYRGLVGAVEAGVIQSQRSAALVQVAEGCMAQRGYLHKPAPPGLPPGVNVV